MMEPARTLTVVPMSRSLCPHCKRTLTLDGCPGRTKLVCPYCTGVARVDKKGIMRAESSPMPEAKQIPPPPAAQDVARPRQRKPDNKTVIIGLSVTAGLVLGCLVGVSAMALFGARKSDAPPGFFSWSKATRPMTEKALGELILGKTTDEVVKLLGAPQRQDVWLDGTVIWRYDAVIAAPGGGVGGAEIFINAGRVSKIRQ